MPSAAALTTSLQIFKPGRHTAMSGQTLAFSEADLAATAAAYDPARHEAPLVVGHPSHDAPAYGWVKSLASTGGAIEATPHQVDASFAEMVGAGRFKKISASFYAPDAPGNPVPGVYYLRHVGFLGAAAPAVKGLRSPSFADGETGVLEFADGWDDRDNASLWRRMREWLITKFSIEDANNVVPGYLVENLEQSAQREIQESVAATSQPVASPAFSAPINPPETAVTPEQARAIEAENARLKADLEAAQRAQRQARSTAVHTDNVAFAEALVSQGRLAKGHQAAIVATLDHLADQDQPIEFGEGAARKPLLTEIKAVLTALPQSVEFGEAATSVRAAAAPGAVLDFAAPDGCEVDSAGMAMHRKVRAYQVRHSCDYMTALTAVQAGLS